MKRNAFTLIEILLITMLLGIGLAAVIGTVLTAIATARQASQWAMAGPMAQSAVDFAVGRGRISYANHAVTVDIPDTSSNWAEAFESPWFMRIDEAPAPLRPAYDNDANLTVGRVKTYRVRMYDTAEDRDQDQRVRGAYLVTQYLRTRP